MTISFSCPECGRKYDLKDELAGKKIKCRGCEAAIRVPDTDEVDDLDDFEEPEANESAGSAEDDFLQDLNRKSVRRSGDVAPAKKKTAKVSRSGGMSTGAKWALGLGIGLGFVALLCCGVPSLVGYFFYQQIAGAETAPAGMSFEQWRASIPTKLERHGPSPQDFEPETPPENVTEILYPSGTLQLKAWVYRPPGVEEPRPALVFFHGGFAFGAGDFEACQPFMDAGYVVMAPMLRGENGNPGEFTLFHGEVNDAKAACQWLAQQPYVNNQRIYTFGHSVGGGVSAVLSMMDNVPIRHGGSSGGLYDHLTFLGWTSQGTVPFENNPRERSIRLLVGNTQLMQRPHYAYIGTEDDPFDDVVKKLQKAGAEKLKVETVPGDHFTSFDESLKRYLQITQADQ
ncbi:MAG TPA: CocE/NonD family hydrolase [Planctomycetaceae bacterium]|nr:CocE/NonD family hydrolase [Planctomycetaceae bacterium]